MKGKDFYLILKIFSKFCIVEILADFFLTMPSHWMKTNMSDFDSDNIILLKL